jgi:hypothetical protein
VLSATRSQLFLGLNGIGLCSREEKPILEKAWLKKLFVFLFRSVNVDSLVIGRVKDFTDLPRLAWLVQEWSSVIRCSFSPYRAGLSTVLGHVKRFELSFTACIFFNVPLSLIS